MGSFDTGLEDTAVDLVQESIQCLKRKEKFSFA